MKNSNLLAVRVEASPETGTGHFSRCLALAMEWRHRGGNVVFISAELPDTLENRLTKHGIQRMKVDPPAGSPDDIHRVVQFHDKTPFTCLVVDGYVFNDYYQSEIAKVSCPVLWIDDMSHLSRYFVTCLLNQNLHADPTMYVGKLANTTCLFGTSYVLLRSEFMAWKHWKRSIPDQAKRLLITFGGSDPGNLTESVLRCLDHQLTEGYEITVLVGASYAHMTSLSECVSFLGRKQQIQVFQNVENVPEMLAWADIGISAGGSTCWEACFLSLPLLVFSLAENQFPVVKSLEKSGAAIALGPYEPNKIDDLSLKVMALSENFEKRTQMSNASGNLVDGNGASRVVDTLRSLSQNQSKSYPK